jgi:hypothetical protein
MKYSIILFVLLLSISGCNSREDVDNETSADKAYPAYIAEHTQEDYEAEMLNATMEAVDKIYIQDQEGEACPYGCIDHKPGCDIKGNISIDTGEKIYYVPGQEFYVRTQINPQYGERWFCTEAEARANGWRRSFK